ncbi:MAG: hypothetical protein A2835_02475 [Candidatus Niyogibacteria bacterium RIFCSPHIGHO2_01_FULL_45_28]|nr:MAG: hypothetical protein A2835_02475 [Candidatus Niyogibacteria bacterium RIFCSPHIGHO2_01_FULL_45_28]
MFFRISKKPASASLKSIKNRPKMATKVNSPNRPEGVKKVVLKPCLPDLGKGSKRCLESKIGLN